MKRSKYYLAVLIAVFVTPNFTSCSGPYSESELSEHYEALDDLEAIFFAERVYVVSGSKNLTDVKFKHNRLTVSAGKVAREGSEKFAWHTSKLNFKDGDVITADAKFDDGSQQTAFLVVKSDAESFRVEFTEKPEFPTPEFDFGLDVDAYMQAFNQLRAKYNRRPIHKVSVSLSKAARANNLIMQHQRRSGHFSPNPYTEIAFYSPRTIQQAIRGYEGSPPHLGAMLGNHECTGLHRIGVSWTQTFSSGAACND